MFENYHLFRTQEGNDVVVVAKSRKISGGVAHLQHTITITTAATARTPTQHLHYCKGGVTCDNRASPYLGKSRGVGTSSNEDLHHLQMTLARGDVQWLASALQSPTHTSAMHTVRCRSASCGVVVCGPVWWCVFVCCVLC
jgi:hypothetical protein